MKLKYILVITVACTLAGCQSYKKIPYLQEPLPHQPAKALLYDARIMPKDLLTIVVSCPEEPQLAEPFNLTIASSVSNTANNSNHPLTAQPTLQQYLVDNEGKIDFPILGSLSIGGLTKGEVEQSIKEKLASQFQRNPIVTVRMVNYKISVIGEVAHPGTFTISNEKVNVLEALAMAGDMTIYGLRNHVKLIREDKGGQQHIITLNLNDSHLLQSPYYYLQQNDILYITPNKTKASTSDISTSTTIWFSVIGSLVSLATLIIAVAK